MTSSRRATPYKVRRDPREVIIAALAVVAVLVVTGALLFVLQPGDDETPSPSHVDPLPSSLPDTTLPGGETVPTTPTVPSTPAPGSSTPGG